MVRDEWDGATIARSELAGEDRSKAATTSRDRGLNLVLRGREAGEKES